MNDCFHRLSLREQREKRVLLSQEENYNILSIAFDQCKDLHGLSSVELWSEIMSLRDSLSKSVRRDLEIQNYPDELCERYLAFVDSDGTIHQRSKEDAYNTAFFVAHGLVMCLVACGAYGKNPHTELILSLLDFTINHPLHDEFAHRTQRSAEDSEEKKGYHYTQMDYLSPAIDVDPSAHPMTDADRVASLRAMSENERRRLAFSMATNQIQQPPTSPGDTQIKHIQDWGIIQRCAFVLHLLPKENDNDGFIKLLESLQIKYIVKKPTSSHLSKYTDIADISRDDGKVQWKKHLGANEKKFFTFDAVMKTFLRYYRENQSDQDRLLS